MKKFFVFVCALAIGLFIILAQTPRAQASSLNLSNPRQIAQTCDTQDPNSPCFAPGERGDSEPGCDIYNPDSPCFAPGERADGTAPNSTSTPASNTPKTSTTATPIPQESFPSKEDILKMTDQDSGGVGLLGALMLSPIVSMLFFVIGFFIFLGVIILVIILVVRRSNKKDNKSDPPVK